MHPVPNPHPFGRSRRAKGLLAGVFAAGFFVAAAHAVPATTAQAPPASATATPRGRVDLYTPSFTHPTRITNPLFPISRVRQVIQLGHEGDEHLRHEVTLLPETTRIRWNGQRVEVLVSQFVAYSDGRILETAVDYFAQDDRGAVWYFGEDVDNYVDGVVDNHDGTWRAGRDGPPGMIMPADPRVGEVYRPENIPGLVFEEVTVGKVNLTVPGPRGPVHGAVAVRERPMDGAIEDKVFAPGYGEFAAFVRADDELVTVAVAVPTDSLGGPVPGRLRTMYNGARALFEDAPDRRWADLAADVQAIGEVWEDHQTGPLPPLLEEQTAGALDALAAAVDARSVVDVRQTANDLARATLDLQMQFRSPVSIDRSRISVWKRQLVVDASTDDTTGVDSDLAILDAIEERLERGDD